MIGKLQPLFFVDVDYDILHVFSEVKDDIFREQHLHFLKVKLPSIEHIPAYGGSRPEDHTHPLSCFLLELVHIGVLGKFTQFYQVIDLVLNFNFTLITKRHNL